MIPYQDLCYTILRVLDRIFINRLDCKFKIIFIGLLGHNNFSNLYG